MKLSSIYSILVLFFPLCLQAQKPDSSGSRKVFPKGMYFEAGGHWGKIIKHTGAIKIPIAPFSGGFELSWEMKEYGKKDWHAYCGYPRLGVAFNYFNFYDEERLGHGIGIFPHITVDFVKRRTWRMFGRLGMGVGIVTKPHNAKHNPQNNIIGSYLNNNTQLRFGFAFNVHRNIELRPSVSFTHFSNGASQLPNLGINVLSFHLGVCFKPNPILPEDIKRPETMPKKNRGFRPQFCLLTGMGMRESAAWGGPKYPVLMTSFDGGIYVARNNRLKLGFEYEWVGSVHAFQQHLGIYTPEQVTWKASRVSVFIEDEILIGRLGLLARIGFYVTNNPQQSDMHFFTRLAMRCYLYNPLLHPRRVNPFVGIALKAHEITAEYFSIQLGTTF